MELFSLSKIMYKSSLGIQLLLPCFDLTMILILFHKLSKCWLLYIILEIIPQKIIVLSIKELWH